MAWNLSHMVHQIDFANIHIFMYFYFIFTFSQYMTSEVKLLNYSMMRENSHFLFSDNVFAIFWIIGITCVAGTTNNGSLRWNHICLKCTMLFNFPDWYFYSIVYFTLLVIVAVIHLFWTWFHMYQIKCQPLEEWSRNNVMTLGQSKCLSK